MRLVARFGQVVTGRVERRWIREVWGHPEVESFKAPRLQQLEPEIIDLEAAGDVIGALLMSGVRPGLRLPVEERLSAWWTWGVTSPIPISARPMARPGC